MIPLPVPPPALVQQASTPEDRSLPFWEAREEDVALAERMLFEEANAARVRNGLPPLRWDSPLARVARSHSQEQVVLGYIDHISPVPQHRTILDRLAAGDVMRPPVLAENIAGTFAAPIHGVPVSREKQKDGTYRLYSPKTSAYIPAYTFREWARAVVEGWLNSPGHRHNLLRPDVSRMGLGVAWRQEMPCPEGLVTQILAADLREPESANSMKFCQ